jgi:PAS domain S-box-containing protein
MQEQNDLAEAADTAGEARLRALAEVMPQIVWQARPDGYHEWFNQRWYGYTGLTSEQSLGSGWLCALHPDDREETRQRWRQATQGGTTYENEYRFRGLDGRYRWFLGRARPYRDFTGQILCWFGTCTDIDEQKRAKETLEQLVAERTAELTSANEALQRSNQELEQFAYVASHDLQEPLRKIQAFGDRLQTRCAAQLGEQGQDYLARVLASATRMRRLIDDLLTFSRISTRQQVPVAVSLAAIAQEVVSDLDGTLQETGGRVEVGALPRLEADALQMRQLLQNLIANGLKFHRPDEPPGVRVQGRLLGAEEIAAANLDPAQTWHEITVEDNGIGFDETYLDRIFQVFQRLHGRNEYEGTGVGLAICRKIAERHGGQISARSRPGQGSAFIVWLPGQSAVDAHPTRVPQ